MVQKAYLETIVKLLTTLLLLISVNALGQPTGALENPSEGSYTSGIYMFSGWVCEAKEVEIVIDGTSGLKAAYGTSRGDTQGICGDSDNGFGLLYNMSLLGTGEHTAVAFADGVEIGRSTFSVQRLTGGEFLRDRQAKIVLPNFPEDGQETGLEWVESAQNFLIASENKARNGNQVEGLRASETGPPFLVVSLHTDRSSPYKDDVYTPLGEITWDNAPIIATYYMTGEAPDIITGILDGDIAYMQSYLTSEIQMQFTITWDSASTATLEVFDCVASADATCPIQKGEAFRLIKHHPAPD